MLRVISAALLACLVPLVSSAAAQSSLGLSIEVIGRGITGLTVTPASPALSCTPAAGFANCLTVSAGTAAGTAIATLTPVTVPKGQAISSITLGGANASLFALSASCNPYVAPCTLSVGGAPIPVSTVDANGNAIPYVITLTITAP